MHLIPSLHLSYVSIIPLFFLFVKYFFSFFTFFPKKKYTCSPLLYKKMSLNLTLKLCNNKNRISLSFVRCQKSLAHTVFTAAVFYTFIAVGTSEGFVVSGNFPYHRCIFTDNIAISLNRFKAVFIYSPIQSNSPNIYIVTSLYTNVGENIRFLLLLKFHFD